MLDILRSLYLLNVLSNIALQNRYSVTKPSIWPKGNIPKSKVCHHVLWFLLKAFSRNNFCEIYI